MSEKIIIAIPLILSLPLISCLDLNLKDEVTWLEVETEQPVDSAPDPDEHGSVEDHPKESAKDPDIGTDSTSENESPPVTDAADSQAPSLVSLDCNGDTSQKKAVCVALGPRNASVRFQTDEAAKITISSTGPGSYKILSQPFTHHHWVFFDGIDSAELTHVQMVMQDINGNNATEEVSFSAVEGSTIAITEILADPLGAEPSQEFIEIFNFGSQSVDVTGWMIDDNGDKNGDYLPEIPGIDPGQSALIVGPSFNPSSGPDPKPPANTRIIVLPGSICSNGLKNSAEESIELYDDTGRLISSYAGNIRVPAEGTSIERISAELPDSDLHSFQPNPLATSTPGHVTTWNTIAP